MIKADKRQSKEAQRPLFHPAFGSRPQEIIGRDDLIASFLDGLDEPIGSQRRCTFFYGQRGMGKTALLLELAEQAKRRDFVTARVTAYEGMPDDIIETIQRNGAEHIKKEKRRVQGMEAGALGFSFGLTFTEEANRQYGFRTKLTLLCDKLAEQDKGLLILVDEARTSEEMRQLAVTYQHLVGEDKNIAIAMAGLPNAISGILNDKVLTFLNRAQKAELKRIGQSEISAYFHRAFSELGIDISPRMLDEAIDATRGFPYLIQLVGYYLTVHAQNGALSQESFDRALREARLDMEENVFQPILHPLSKNDLAFLKAMAVDDDETRTASLEERLGASNSHIQPYRARLIDAGVIEAPRRGVLTFAVPYLAEYLREHEF